MKSLFTRLSLALLLATGLAACDSFVEDVDLPINSIGDEQLNDESQIPFQITGIQSRFSTSYDRVAVFAGGISDELFFTENVPNATFPSFAEMDVGDIGFANNSNDGLYNDIGELWLYTNRLLERLDEIEVTDADLEREARFTAHFYGGIARYFLAAYYALTPDQPGGVIDAGPFIPSAELYSQALQQLEQARQFADAYHTRVINTLIARIELFQGDYGAALAAAENGMTEGDEPVASLHTAENTNYWYIHAGAGRTQWVVDDRFQAYIDADPNEANRIALEDITGVDGTTVYKRQALYPLRETPLPFATWQENNLIIAEVEIRQGDVNRALALINDVRASHGIDPIADATLDVLITERDKELFTMGLRLPDQRRFNAGTFPAGPWRYLPITQSERNGNENI